MHSIVGDDLGRSGTADRDLGSRRVDRDGLQHRVGIDALIEGRDEHRRRVDRRVLRRERQHLRRWSPERPADSGRQLVPGLRRGARGNFDAVAGCHREAIDRAAELEAQRAGTDPAPPALQCRSHLDGNGGLVELRQRAQRNHRLTERDAQVGGDVDVTDRLVAEHPQGSGVGRQRLRRGARAEGLRDRGADARARDRFRRALERNRAPAGCERRETIHHRGDGGRVELVAVRDRDRVAAGGLRVTRSEHHGERPGGTPDPDRDRSLPGGRASSRPHCTRRPRRSGIRRWPPTNGRVAPTSSRVLLRIPPATHCRIRRSEWRSGSRRAEKNLHWFRRRVRHERPARRTLCVPGLGRGQLLR